jgi:hypothetical protein
MDKYYINDITQVKKISEAYGGEYSIASSPGTPFQSERTFKSFNSESPTFYYPIPYQEESFNQGETERMLPVPEGGDYELDGQVLVKPKGDQLTGFMGKLKALKRNFPRIFKYMILITLFIIMPLVAPGIGIGAIMGIV